MLKFGESEFGVHGVVMDVMRSEDQKLRPGEKAPEKAWRSISISFGRGQFINVSAGVPDWDLWRVGDTVIVRGELHFEEARVENGRNKPAKMKIKNVKSLSVRQPDGRYAEQIGSPAADPAAAEAQAGVVRGAFGSRRAAA